MFDKFGVFDVSDVFDDVSDVFVPQHAAPFDVFDVFDDISDMFDPQHAISLVAIVSRGWGSPLMQRHLFARQPRW